MSFVEFDSEKIVESFESSDNFKGWNQVQLFILYDSESAKYLFNIIDGFELKNKVRQCKNFSFQIKLEEKPIDLNGNVEELLKYLENGDAVVIAEKDKKIKALKNEIKEKEETIKKLESASSEKDKTISKLNKQVEKQKEDLKEMQSNLDPYSKLNFIDKGDYIELKKPIGTIKKIQKGCVRRNFSNAEKYANNLALDGGGWRLPTKEELKTIYKIKDVCGIKNVDGLFWCSKKNVVDFCCKTNGARASLLKFNLLTTDTSKNYYVRCVK
ncbi:hypothetical protein IKO70_02905 [bacterium]|nr:hypothetical protein [bacterium]